MLDEKDYSRRSRLRIRELSPLGIYCTSNSIRRPKFMPTMTFDSHLEGLLTLGYGLSFR